MIAYQWYQRLHKFGSSGRVAVMLGIACAISILTTYFSISRHSDPFGTNVENVQIFIIIDLILLLALCAIIFMRVAKLIIQKRKRSVGSSLQTRIVAMFSLVAILPTILLVLFSSIFFNYGIQAWFNQRVSNSIEGSLAIAQAYLEEHKKIIKADVAGMANDLYREAYIIRKNPYTFNKALAVLAGVRKIPEAIIFETSGENKKILARTHLSFTLQLMMEELSHETLKRATDGELVVLTNDTDDRVIAMIKLEGYFDTYLLVGRFVDKTIINHIENTEGAVTEYNKLKANVSSLQVRFLIIFVIVSLLVLLMVVWFGLIFAVELVSPISTLVEATEKVKKGDFSSRVKEGKEQNEITTLSRAFNQMTETLDQQRKDLISAQRIAAWSEVAKRIAHEIKNPLTPIHLAAERLKRKYSNDVKDKANFNKYADTIIRHVGDIGNIVEEFASFARMPAPKFELYDMTAIIRDTIFSQEAANPSITYSISGDKQPINLSCDRSQVTQVFTNILKNAAESITEKNTAGTIDIAIQKKPEHCTITIQDNGPGIPEHMLERLTEPYVTNKTKGTGLGLAIVKKIVEEHNGTITFKNTSKGACVSLQFALKRPVKKKS